MVNDYGASICLDAVDTLQQETGLNVFFFCFWFVCFFFFQRNGTVVGTYWLQMH